MNMTILQYDSINRTPLSDSDGQYGVLLTNMKILQYDSISMTPLADSDGQYGVLLPRQLGPKGL